MRRRDDLTHREPGDGCQRMWAQVERRRPRPGAFHDDVLEPVVDKLQDARGSVHMRDDLQKIIRLDEVRMGRAEIERIVLEAHGPGGDAHGAIVERSDQRILVDAQAGLGVFLGEAPQLAAAIDGGAVIQIHGVAVAARLALEFHRDDLAGLRVVAEAGRIRHANELVFDERLVEGEGFRYHPLKCCGIGPVGDDEIFAIDEAIGPRRESRARERHGEGARFDFVDFHRARSFGSVSRSRVRSSTFTPSSGRLRFFQAGWLKVRSTSARPACQCSSIE